MKKIIALLLVAVMAIGFCACAAKTETPAEPAATEETTTTEPAATEETTEEPAAEETETTENQHFDKLTLEFVPSKDADVIITGTKNLPELVQAEMSKLGYDIDEVDITVGTSYDATGEAMSAGSIDLGWLPGGDHAIFTHADSTIAAIEAGLELLRDGGLMCVSIYYGGASGYEERDTLLEYVKTIDPDRYTVLVTQFANRAGDPPIPVLIWKAT